jgi:hypothetical protein
MFKKIVGGIFFFATLFIAWLNIDSLNAFYGSGPPYYSRTTNMDKWENPLPYIFMVDGITFAVWLVFFVITNDKRKK